MGGRCTNMGSKGIKFTAVSTSRSAPSFSIGGRTHQKVADQSAPGPGKYGVPSDSQATRTAPSFGFGGAPRLCTKKFEKQPVPGPGAYSSLDPNETSAAWGFGSEARIPQKKLRKSPDPGQYTAGSTLTTQQMTMSGRFEGKKKEAHATPAPGQYGIPRTDGVLEKLPDVPAMRFTEDRERMGVFRSKSIAPGPGKYESMKEMGNGNPTSTIPPSFTMGSRRRPLKRDTVPGPAQIPHYTQFG